MLSEEVKRYKSESIPYQIARVKLLMAKVFSRCLKKEDIALTPEQMQMLGLLMEKESSYTYMNEISNELMVDNSAVTRLVDTLESKGFVKRKICKEDRRQRVVSITSLGKAEMLKTIELTEAHKKRMLTGVSAAEQQDFMRILRLIQCNVETFSDELERENLTEA